MRNWENHPTPPNALLAQAEALIAKAGPDAQIVVIVRIGQTIQIRDNSGVEGLTGQPLMDKTLDLLHEVFPGKFTE